MYQNLLTRCDKSMTCVQTHAVGAPIRQHVLRILDIGGPKPRFGRGPDELLLAGTTGNDQPSNQISTPALNSTPAIEPLGKYILIMTYSTISSRLSFYEY